MIEALSAVEPTMIYAAIAVILGGVAVYLKGKYKRMTKELQDVADVFAKAKRKRSEEGRDLSRGEYRQIVNEGIDVVNAAFFVKSDKKPKNQ